MPELAIPTEHQKALSSLQGLSDKLASELLNVITSAARNAANEYLTIADLSDVPGLSRSVTEEILDMLLSLYRVRAYSEVPVDDFVNDILNSVRSSTHEGFDRSNQALAHFRERLVQFFRLEELNRSAKATVLRYEHERSIHSLRIFTDARPIFGSGVITSPVAFVIFHVLKLVYHQSGNLTEEFFSFDEDDLESLRDAVHRAELKASELRAALEKAQMKVINVG